MQSYNTIAVEKFGQILEELGRSQFINLESHDLLLFGGGGLEKKYFIKLAENPRCKVLWSGWCGPGWTSIFSFIPGQAGLIKLLDQDILNEFYAHLASYSVSELLYVPKAYTVEIIKEVKQHTWKKDFEQFIGNNSSFLITAEIDEPIYRKGEELYFYDYKIGTGLDAALGKIVSGN